MPLAELYRGIVSHKRWLPRPHGFAYEMFMTLLDVDHLDDSFQGLWPLASATTSYAFASFRPSDHLKGGHLAPGRPFGECVRTLIASRVPGYHLTPAHRILLLTHLRYFGYTFNPISLYYVMAPGGTCECILAEVSNTPWNEMHFYVLHVDAPGVKSERGEWGSAPSGGRGLGGSSSSSSSIPLPISLAAQGQLKGKGAVAPLDFDALAARFATPISDKCEGGTVSSAPRARAGSSSSRGKLSSSSSSSSSIASSSRSGSTSRKRGHSKSTTGSSQPSTSKDDMLRFSWAKDFHVSPFFGMDHIYDWRFSQPNGSDLLVQSANWKGGETVFTTQLVLEREPMTWSHLAFMLFVAFPFLTFRIQWWIHYEAVRLFLRGIELFPHPTGARNAFVNTVETLVVVVMATVSFCKGGCCGGGRQKGGGGEGGPPAGGKTQERR